MNCNKCGQEMPEGSQYCNKCGANQATNPNGVAKFFNLFHGKRKVLVIGITAIVIVSVITGVFLASDPTRSLMKAIRENDYTQASAVYNENILGDTDKENKLKERLGAEIKDVRNSFKDEKIAFNKAVEELEAIKKIGLLYSDANNAINEIAGLNNSRLSYKKGIEFKKSNNLIDAMIELNRVIKEDSDYEQAQAEIKKISVEFKKQVLTQVESAMAKTDYENAVKVLSDGLTAMPNDADFIAKKANCEKLLATKQEEQQRQLMKKLVDSQEVAVVGVSQYTDSIDTNFISVSVINRTSKTVKSYTIGFMGFDRNGLPVKVGLGRGDFVGKGNNDQNILPGETKNSNGGWYLDNHDVKTLIACVEEVEYYSGEKWANSYYSVWQEQYAEKPLNK